MHFTEQGGIYLTDSEHHSQAIVEFTLDKMDTACRSLPKVLCHMVKGKRIIHFGCIDKPPTLLRKPEIKKKWLHSALCRQARRCHGVDTDRRAIAFIRDELGYNDTSSSRIDEESFSDLIRSDHWDALLLSSSLTWQSDPTRMFRTVTEKCAGHIPQLIIAIPNALALENHLQARQHRQCTDNRCCCHFTPFSLARSLHNAGLSHETLQLCSALPRSWIHPLKNSRLRKYPLLRDSIICTAPIR